MSTFYDWVFANKKIDKDKPLLADHHRHYCFRDIEESTVYYLSILKKEEIQGKKVALIIPSLLTHLSLFLAINRLGGTVIPLSWQLRHNDLTNILKSLDPGIVFTISFYNKFDFAGAVNSWAKLSGKHTVIYLSRGGNWERTVYEGEKRDLENDKIELISCSSGSTGTPKGIMINSDSMIHWVKWLENISQIKGTDRAMSTAPISTAYGVMWLFISIRNQAFIVFNESFDVISTVQTYYANRCTKLITSPSVFRVFHQFFKQVYPETSNQLELVLLGGELVTSEFVQAISDVEDAQIINAYGLSETGGIMVNDKVLEKNSFFIRGDANFRVEPEEGSEEGTGELVVRLPGIFSGYYKRPDLTKQIVSEENWVYTGDLVKQVGQREVEVIGRKKDIIKKGGQVIIPSEIEDSLTQEINVKRAVVVGIPHQVYGEQVAAFLQLEGEISMEQIRANCLSQLARYKVPDRIIVIDDFPMIQGKIDKVSLRQLVKGRI
ncbi:class I adenylate-forming enzyme family protein [Gracilibacillus ureilyticus]|uniref:class I adenylate-forming enzyme family protein n=1 Tax=Gracilibacillus ureilyticus TaxID=531814 RepID=UPI001587B44E|nr:class I adenylate-forming enzyme family protein [Gracilibacillus ureilyticus]